MESVAVLLPTLYRPQGLERVLRSLLGTPYVFTVIALEIDDFSALALGGKYECVCVLCKEKRAGPAYAWNEALRDSPYFDVYVLGSDDVEFMPGWLDEGLKVLHEQLGGSGMVAFNDGTGKVERAGFATQYMMTRDFIIKNNGGVAACPHYPVDFADVETSIRARLAGKFAYAKNAKVIHHWREVDDEGYRRADTLRKKARKIFEERKAAGFPDDFERII